MLTFLLRENVENPNYLAKTACREVFSGFYKKQFNFSTLVNHVSFTTFNNNIQKAVGEKDVEMLAVIMKDSIKSSNKANNSRLLNIKNSLIVTATALIQPYGEIYVVHDL